MTRWTFRGHLPMEMGRADVLRFSNDTAGDAEIEMTVHYADAKSVGPYRLRVLAGQQRLVRVNDLIDPLPVPLDTDYSLEVRSGVPIEVEFTPARQ